MKRQSPRHSPPDRPTRYPMLDEAQRELWFAMEEDWLDIATHCREAYEVDGEPRYWWRWKCAEALIYHAQAERATLKRVEARVRPKVAATTKADPHGTAQKYRRGCRCHKCRAAEKLYRQLRKKRRS